MNRDERRAARARIGRLAIVERDGERMQIIRPRDPAAALAIAHAAAAKNDAARFANLPEEVGNYTFVGYFATHAGVAYAVDEEGNILDRVQAGDSYVTPKEAGGEGQAEATGEQKEPDSKS